MLLTVPQNRWQQFASVQALIKVIVTSTHSLTTFYRAPDQLQLYCPIRNMRILEVPGDF
jgi:hypothetical protein